MIPVEIIRKKREGMELSPEELQDFVRAYVSGTIPDYQMAAWLMAVYFRGMTETETLAFTRVMLHSGTVVDLSSVPGVKVDKHSTGGVGDKVSIILAPLVAACGVPVPMISGRGLGHTGGTLDKLESIPGFRTDLDIPAYTNVIQKIGVVMIGQTKDIAPADKKMYALRDVTATVECIPLIAGSIMSKKLAEGIDALVLDVKTGSGAFMRRKEDAVELARTLIRIGEGFGKRTMAYLTDMNQPLGNEIGNWSEVRESIRCLQGEEVPDLMRVAYRLAGAMLCLGGKAKTVKAGEETAREAIRNGKAYQKFLELVREQEGDSSYIEDLSKYPEPSFTEQVCLQSEGTVVSIDNQQIGLAALVTGAGRKRVEDEIDYTAGITIHRKIGDEVRAGETVATVYGNNRKGVANAVQRIASAYTVSDRPAQPPPLILGSVDADGFHGETDTFAEK
jgi:pyrimidine-nucleoside phosphorylase